MSASLVVVKSVLDGRGSSGSSRRLIQIDGIPSSRRRGDVVVEALGNVHVPDRVRSSDALPEHFPVPVCRLVRLDLARDDGEVEVHADRVHRRVDQISIRVRKDPQPPASLTRLRQTIVHVLEHGPRRQRAGESAGLALRQHEPRLRGELLERDRQHLAIGDAGGRRLDLRLQQVVPSQQLVGVLDAEELLELVVDPAVPVDERPVAVERRPAFHGASLMCSS